MLVAKADKDIGILEIIVIDIRAVQRTEKPCQALQEIPPAAKPIGSLLGHDFLSPVGIHGFASHNLL